MDRNRGYDALISPPQAASVGVHQRNRKRSHDEFKNSLDISKLSEEQLLINDRNKYKSMRTRVLSSVWMIGGFILVLYMGHMYIWAMIVGIQILMAHELFTFARAAQREKQLPGFRLLNWHFFFTAMVYVYGRFLSKQFVNTISSDKLLSQLFSGFIQYHMLICYCMYIAGKLGST
ncbi:hypothetical protein O6H91_05G031600 [Diphasiastrum complanatum]|uniref:Uncharacterized protein n=1 Tax=Diphasiastrum complanatum TaxID=34168 RepID=A0ACC2DM39_DIPCM|nr:hypothetical protein O6H91_05G031600 [Diphasiastrum complanatum]